MEDGRMQLAWPTGFRIQVLTDGALCGRMFLARLRTLRESLEVERAILETKSMG